ncbi:phage tail tape measure protein [Blastochloris tepida]|uniref:Phage tail tape measure protein domain-containing protein n=1 Tax=Blastochloris tepida TaxID=2233851 RepID=A0A348FYG3_9HYPH|nr:phage tail tape measure protein [Blastochloris tepida]BBF92346.1 hypothetical protein BLTE_10310 [Blastochloris tepida]
MSGFKVSMIVELVDRLTGPAKAVERAGKGIEQAIEGVNRAGGKTNTTAWTAHTRGAQAAEKAAKAAAKATRDAEREAAKAAKSYEQLGSRIGNAIATIGGAGLIGKPIVSAAKFEEAWADFSKIANLSADKDNALREAVLKRAASSRTNAAALTELLSGLASSGVPDDELLDYLDMLDKASVAFGLSGKDAGRDIGFLRTNLKMTKEEFRDLLDTLNFLENKTNASAKDLLKFMRDSAGIMRQSGIGYADQAAIGAAALSLQSDPGKVARSISALLAQLQTAQYLQHGKKPNPRLEAFERLGVDPKQLADSLKKDPIAAISAFLAKVNEAKDPLRELVAIMGKEWMDEIGGLAAARELIEQARQYARDPARTGSMEEEYQKKLRTTIGLWERLKNATDVIFTRLGDKYLPSINAFLTRINAWLGANEGLAVRIAEIGTAAVGVLAGLGALSMAAWVFSPLKGAVLGVGRALWWVGATAAPFVVGMLVRSIAAIGRVLAVMVLSNPVTATLLAIGAAALWVYENWGMVKGALTSAWQGIEGAVTAALEGVKSAWTSFVAWLEGIVAAILAKMAAIGQAIRNAFTFSWPSLPGWLQNLVPGGSGAPASPSKFDPGPSVPAGPGAVQPAGSRVQTIHQTIHAPISITAAGTPAEVSGAARAGVAGGAKAGAAALHDGWALA